MFKKIVITSFLIMLLVSAIFLGGVFNYAKKNNITVESELKNIFIQTEKIVYQQATMHNPEGDRLPDWIDNAIWHKLKNIKERI